ncbi:MAG: PBSX family phage terminase large subunit [Sulfuricaulis sp.]|nr:PBSX family phage terminase large subunit [Sulfuricaulis sp.]
MTLSTSSPTGRVVEFPTARAYVPFLKPSRYKGAYGGRGSAKSHEFAKNVLKRCIERPGSRVVCVREIQRTLEQSVKRLLEDKIEAYGLKDQFHSTNTQIEAPGNGLIIFQGMQDHTAESIKSLEGFDVAWVEEAQTVSERSLTLLRPTIREPDSEIWMSWNPRHQTDPVDVLLRGKDGPPPDAVVVGTTHRDNPWFPDVLRVEMEWDRSRDPEKYAHVWLGEYERKSESRVFKNWTTEDFDTPADASFLFGGDWGYSVDPSVLVRCYTVGRKLFIDHESYKIGVEIDDLPALFDMVPGCRDWTITADSARPETISYLNRHGFPKLVAAVKGKDSVKEGVIFLQNYDIVVHPRCVHTIDELTMYSFVTDKLTGLVTPVLEDKKNHVIDSLRYAVERLRANEFEWQKAGMTSSATW